MFSVFKRCSTSHILMNLSLVIDEFAKVMKDVNQYHAAAL